MIDTFDGLIWVDAVRQCPVSSIQYPVSSVRASTETCWLIAARWLQSQLQLDLGTLELVDLESEQRTRCWEFNQKCQRQLVENI